MEFVGNREFGRVLLLLVAFFIIAFSAGCQEVDDKEENKGLSLEYFCDNYQVVERYHGNIGVVREIIIGDNKIEGSYVFRFHDQFTKKRPQKLYIILAENNDVLVPSEHLPDNLKLDSVEVKFSGKKSDCCNVLTHTNWRVGFGCMTEITFIEILNDK